jgi:hypothetical protein
VKRRKLARADSLDLLLSTMTSSFGGIILIAILVVLVSHNTKKISDQSRIIAANNAILERKIDKAKADIATASDLKNSLQTTLALPENAAITTLMAERDRLKARLDDALAKIAALGALAKSSQDTSTKDPSEILRALNNGLADLKNQKEKELARQSALAAQMATLKGRLADLAGETEKDYNEHVRKLRLPKERENSKQAYNFILRYNKVYPLSDINGGPNRKTLDWVKQPDGQSVEVQPIEGAGLDVHEDHEAIISILKSIPRDQFYATVYLYGDSFKTFGDLKELIIEAGLEYGWQPETPVQKLLFSDKGTSPPPL